jgi:hypothetical protein
MEVLDVRGTPAWQIKGYLAHLGGHEEPDGSFGGSGWHADLTEGEVMAFHTKVPRVTITFLGNPDVVHDIEERVKLRCIRCGG